MRVNHNSLAISANNHLTSVDSKLAKSIARLSSGYKINKASDDTVGMAISQKMQAQIRGLDRANDNSENGISMLQTADGALNEIHSILARIRELATQAANDTLAVEDRKAAQEEIDSLADEITRISETTDFNGRILLDGDSTRRTYAQDSSGTRIHSAKVLEMSDTVDAGEYTVKITGNPTKGMLVGGAADSSSIGSDGITTEQSGSIIVNDIIIPVEVGDTYDEVCGRIVEYCDYVNVTCTADASGFIFESQLYGSNCGVSISCSNDALKSIFGLTGFSDGNGDAVTADENGVFSATGTDIEAEFLVDAAGERLGGFSESALIITEGTQVTIKDRGDFQMKMDFDAGFSGEATFTVLSAGPLVLQIGENEGQILSIDIPEISRQSLGLENLNVYTHEYAAQALEKLDAAVTKVSQIRSHLGSYQNRLEYTVTNLETASENMTNALSGILDTDMATEITEYSQQSLLSQVGMQILSKANTRPESILQLLQ